MLREVTIHSDWGEKTMSMMREKQFEACERRLSAHPGLSLFSPDTTDVEVQALMDSSYYHQEMDQTLVTVENLRKQVFTMLPTETLYLSQGESQLLERLLISDGSIKLTEWDDIGAAEALVSRLWCSFHITDEDWMLELPKALHEPILIAMNTPDYAQKKELLFRYDAMMMGLLYIAGFLHCSQPIQTFTRDVMASSGRQAENLARRYLKSSFEYMTDSSNQMILLHPGLADPYRLIAAVNSDELFTLELSQEMMAGGMNGLFPEEEPLHEAMCGALEGSLRPEYDVAEATEDLRMLAKQGVSLVEMEAVMASMLCVLPTQEMKQALEQLHQCTPHWIGLRADLQH
ncbi:MAG: hypothetical protein GXY67_12355 [Clostridiales bacterium]|nr:hypothetical protein [Clostridiales bacterium]